MALKQVCEGGVLFNRKPALIMNAMLEITQ